VASKLYILKARDGRLNKFDKKFNLSTLRFEETTSIMDELPKSRPSTRKRTHGLQD
jgi:hypothetical protein